MDNGFPEACCRATPLRAQVTLEENPCWGFERQLGKIGKFFAWVLPGADDKATIHVLGNLLQILKREHLLSKLVVLQPARKEGIQIINHGDLQFTLAFIPIDRTGTIRQILQGVRRCSRFIFHVRNDPVCQIKPCCPMTEFTNTLAGFKAFCFL